MVAQVFVLPDRAEREAVDDEADEVDGDRAHDPRDQIDASNSRHRFSPQKRSTTLGLQADWPAARACSATIVPPDRAGEGVSTRSGALARENTRVTSRDWAEPLWTRKFSAGSIAG